MATAPDIGVTYAKGETIPFTWTSISYAGKTPTSLTGIDFIFTVLDYSSRTSKLRATNGVNGLSATVSDNEVTVSISVDTDTDSYSAGGKYEFDLWVIDSATGKHRIDTGTFTLDTPETTDLTIS